MAPCLRWVWNGRRMSRQSAFQSVQRLVFSSSSIVTLCVCFLMRFGASKRTVPSPIDFTSRSGSASSGPPSTRSPSLWPRIPYFFNFTGTSPYCRHFRSAPQFSHATGETAVQVSFPSSQSPWPQRRHRNLPRSPTTGTLSVPRSQTHPCHLSW